MKRMATHASWALAVSICAVMALSAPVLAGEDEDKQHQADHEYRDQDQHIKGSEPEIRSEGGGKLLQGESFQRYAASGGFGRRDHGDSSFRWRSPSRTSSSESP